MANSNTPSKGRKPHKTTDILTARSDGRWCKRYSANGIWRWWYFRGTEADALTEWNRVKVDLIAGRTPSEAGDKLTIQELCNRFLVAKRTSLDNGTLNGRTFFQYKRTTDVMVDILGLARAVTDLRPDDFGKLYRSLASKHGVHTLGREVTIVRSVCKYAFDADLIDKPVKFGPDFKLPSTRNKRRERNKNKRERGACMFSADEIIRMLNMAGPQLRAMILLGINGGLGNTDCANLHLSHLDLDGGWLDYPRPKTEIDRRIPLWPETVKAIKLVIAKRRRPSDPAHAGMVFLTAKRGQPWVRFAVEHTTGADGIARIAAKADDAIAKEMRKLLDDLNIHRKRVTFYALRHTFETIAGGCRDQVAVDSVMGHADASMAAEYRENIEDTRLMAAVNTVRDWLFGKKDMAKQRNKVKADVVPKPRQPNTKSTNKRTALRIVG